jgi:SAM-dependent methyltransferase
MYRLPGSELYWDTSLGRLERIYCRLLGIPIIGLRIRLRRVARLLPKAATSVLDAGCGRGVIARYLARRYSGARVEGVDENARQQSLNSEIARRTGLHRCVFTVADLVGFRQEKAYDLIVSVDNLEHVENDVAVLGNFHASLRDGGMLVVHVPHYYRRWPIFRLTRNFDVPGHVRPGYHLPELTERVRRAGFHVLRTGFSYGWLENLINNLSYTITGARERNRLLYAALFPLLNALAWCGQWGWPGIGAGVWLVAEKSSQNMSAPIDDEE